jgi:hypothetical protein
VTDLGLEPVIVVRDREVASVQMDSPPPWWQRLIGFDRRVEIQWLPAVQSLLLR